MRLFKATVLVTGLLASASYASALDLGAVCCDGGYEYRNRNRFEAGKAGDDMAARLAALEKERLGWPPNLAFPGKGLESKIRKLGINRYRFKAS